MTPLEKVEALFDELVQHYGEAEDREIRAATKLLLVAIAQLKTHDEHRWKGLMREYISLAEDDPDKFERILNSNRSTPNDVLLA